MSVFFLLLPAAEVSAVWRMSCMESRCCAPPALQMFRPVPQAEGHRPQAVASFPPCSTRFFPDAPVPIGLEGINKSLRDSRPTPVARSHPTTWNA